MAARRAGRRWRGRPLIAILAALAGMAGEAAAHGGPVKVVENRFVVTAALWPAGDGMQLRFFMRDFHSGRALDESTSFRARVLADGSRAVVHESGVGAVDGGRADVFFRVPTDGFYEVFLQFWSDGDPSRVYEPEDWRVWIGTSGGPSPWHMALLGATAALALAMVRIAVSHRRVHRTDGP
jgi:hypothetical protein